MLPMMKLIGKYAFYLALVLLLAGCASPAYRIKKNPELFASFTPEVQEKVREGRIDIGFTRNMVLIALGPPARIYTRTTSGGETEIWSYADIRYETESVPVQTTYWYHDSTGRLRLGHDWSWMDVSRRRAEESLRVEFSENKVAAFETLKNP